MMFTQNWVLIISTGKNSGINKKSRGVYNKNSSKDEEKPNKFLQILHNGADLDYSIKSSLISGESNFQRLELRNCIPIKRDLLVNKTLRFELDWTKILCPLNWGQLWSHKCQNGQWNSSRWTRDPFDE